MFVALFSGVAGTVLGLIVAGAGLSRAGWSTGRAAGVALLSVLAIAGGTAGVARALADVPPEIDGEPLYLLLELRWPAGARPPDPASGLALVRLGTMSGPTVRREVSGPLFLDDARLDGTSWVVPGAVEIFTSRGTPTAVVSVGDEAIASFLPPLRHYPRREDTAWSEWRPATRDDAPAPAMPVSYRFRVSPRNAALRRQAVGPLTVETRADRLHVSGVEAVGSNPRFDVRLRGKVVPGFGDVSEVAVVSAAPLALLARVDAGCRLLTMSGDDAVVADTPPCRDDGRVWRMDGQADRAGARRPGDSWLDRHTFTTSGLYLLGPSVLDTRTLTFLPGGWPNEPTHVQDLPPLGLSPDRLTMAWFSPGNGYDEPPVVATRRLDTGAVTTLPIDRRLMRYRTPALDMDAAWLAHHFAWVPGGDGADRLETRPDIVPLPYRGALSPAATGEYQSYTIELATRRLQPAVVEVLLKELGGTPLPEESATAATPRVEVEGLPLSVQYVDGSSTVSVHSFKSRPEIMARVAARLDAILASGRLDSLMGEEP